ncbi:unnamed protein product [Pieris macdunnoughi]|uniref:Uncharacterized protein n=1 Tax=Pieris macdunnoughi TaxID=345717 RepID=A0A821VLJ9_9NEOP|nr:unnamed protein product [Pieris macdunnoughi]
MPKIDDACQEAEMRLPNASMGVKMTSYIKAKPNSCVEPVLTDRRLGPKDWYVLSIRNVDKVSYWTQMNL